MTSIEYDPIPSSPIPFTEQQTMEEYKFTQKPIYQTVKLLGKGAFGHVFLVNDLEKNEQLVIT